MDDVIHNIIYLKNKIIKQIGSDLFSPDSVGSDMWSFPRAKATRWVMRERKSFFYISFEPKWSMCVCVCALDRFRFGKIEKEREKSA